MAKNLAEELIQMKQLHMVLLFKLLFYLVFKVMLLKIFFYLMSHLFHLVLKLLVVL